MGQTNIKNVCIEAAAIFGGSFLFAYIKIALATGAQHLDKWLLPLVYGLFYGAITFIVFQITYRIAKSPVLFFAISWLVAVALIGLDAIAAAKAMTSLREFGLNIYVDGQLTPAGFFYRLFDPIGIMAFFSTAVLLRNFYKRKERDTKLTL